MDKIKISNFRKIRDTWQLDLSPVTFFTGTNNSGKSTILKAMLLLEDFVKSSNHFQLDFNDNNSRKHKIDSYSNAVNKHNEGESNYDLKFEFSNKGHQVFLVFKPEALDDDNSFQKGRLRELKIIRTLDKSSLRIENVGADDYYLFLDNTFLDKRDNDSDKTKNEIEEVKNNLNLKLDQLTKELNFLTHRRNEIVHSNIKSKKILSPPKYVGNQIDFSEWLERRSKEGSNMPSSYIKALELLSNKIGYNIFNQYNLQTLSVLYRDVLNEQKIQGGKFYNADAPSYGESGFYSAALRKYMDFLDEMTFNSIRLNKALRELNISLETALKFLEDKGIMIEPSPTTKISEYVYTLLFNEFKIDSINKKSYFEFYQVSKKENERFEEEFNNQDSSDLERRLINLRKEINSTQNSLKEIILREKSIGFYKKNKVLLSPHFSLNEFDKNFLRIDSIISKIIPKYLKENEKNLGKIDENTELERAYKFGEYILEILQFDIDHLSPQRNAQNRLYLNNDTSTDINELIKEHSMNPILKNSKAGKFLKDWMVEFDIGQDFKIKPIEGLASKIEITHEGKRINLADKGFGAGQMFTILLKIALEINKQTAAKKSTIKIILIEEPEANLHPALQSKLVDLFFMAYKEYRIRFILETHSEYVLRKSQVLTKELHEGNSNSKNVIKRVFRKWFPERLFSAYYFDKENGPYIMKYDKEGKFVNDFGDGFFDVSRKLTRQLL